MRNAPMSVSLTCLALVAVLAVPARANLLVNGAFELAPCTNGWTRTATTNNCLRDPSTNPLSPKEGLHCGGSDIGGNGPAEAHIFQTVNVISGQPIRLTGWIAGIDNPFNGTTFFVRIHNGTDITSTTNIVASVEYQMCLWTYFDISGTPTGTQVTVEWGYVMSGSPSYRIVTLRVDAFDLTQTIATCTGEPTGTTLSQNYGVSGSTAPGIQLTGTNFDATCEVSLRGTDAAGNPYPNIDAINEAASPDGTTLTFDVPIPAGAAMGTRNLVVTKANCNGLTMNNVFYVVLPMLTNGSFEDPADAASCPTPTQHPAPTNWLETGISTAASHLVRDASVYPPSCPRPDGDHYASIVVPIGTSFSDWDVYQYIATPPDQQITVSGMFAGGGRTTVELQIRDGSETGSLATRVIERKIGCPAVSYNWVPASVSATPTKGFITLVWHMHGEQGAFGTEVIQAAHADKLVLTQGAPPAEICGNGIDDDGNRKTDCQDHACASDPACATPPVEICGNGIDDDGDLNIDCDDSDCAASCVEICNNGIDDNNDCQIDEGCTEICDNGIDDNQNGLTDCADPECAASPLCAEVCDNGIDDNNDGKVDCYDPVCANAPNCQCHATWGDSDGDDDVDMDDFAALQRCIDVTAAFSQSCVCFDINRDGDVDSDDVASLIGCASGSGVPAVAGCK